MGFSQTDEKDITLRARRNIGVVFDEDIVSHYISMYDWSIKEGLMGEYELLLGGLQLCVRLSLKLRTTNLDRISNATI